MSSEAQKEKCIVVHQNTQIDEKREGVRKPIMERRTAVFNFCTLTTIKNMKAVTSDIKDRNSKLG